LLAFIVPMPHEVLQFSAMGMSAYVEVIDDCKYLFLLSLGEKWFDSSLSL